MKKNKMLTVLLILLLIVSNIIGVFAETYNFNVNMTVTREFSRDNVIIDYVNDSNNDVVITYTIKPDDIDVNKFPVKSIPKEVVLVIDKSGSMAWDLNGNNRSSLPSRMEIVKEAANDFVDNLAKFKNVKLSVVTYSSRADIYNSNNPLLDVSNSGNASAIKNYISSIDANGGTNIGDAIRRGYYTLNNGSSTADKYLVFLTDGEPTTYSYYQDNGRTYFFENDGSAPNTNTSDGYALDYAKLMTRKLESITQKYFIAFSNNGANKLKEISEEITSYYKNALTADEIKDVYNDILKKIVADLNIKDVVLNDVLPDGLTIVDYPDGMTVNGQNIRMPVEDVSFTLNSEKTKYVAEPVVVKITVRRNMPGTFNFATNFNSGFSYTDLDGSSKYKSFSSGNIVFESEPVKNVIADRTTIKLNEVNLSWDLYPGAEGYNIYKIENGVEKLIFNKTSGTDVKAKIDIALEDSSVTTYKVAAVLKGNQLSGKGSDSADTRPSILNLTVEREGDKLTLEWDAINGATNYMITPTISGVMKPVIESYNNTGKFESFGNRVRYVYNIIAPGTPYTTSDTIEFNVDGEKNLVDAYDANSDKFPLKELIITSIISDLSDFKYGSSKNVETIYSSSSLPVGVKIYNPVLVVELNVLNKVTNLELEYSYSTLDIILNGNLVDGTVTRDDKGSIKLYISDIDFGTSDNTFPENTSVKLSNKFSVSFESDAKGELKPEVLAVIRGIPAFSDAEAWDIEFIIKELLENKYPTTKDTILQLKTYVIYDETNKISVLPNVRDKKISVKSEYIKLNNSIEIPKEY